MNAQMLSNLMIITGIVFISLTMMKLLSVRKKVNQSNKSSRQTLKILFKATFSLIILLLLGFTFSLSFVVSETKFNIQLLQSGIFLCTGLSLFVATIFKDVLFNSNKTQYFQLLKILVSAMELRDHYTKGHSEHVANLLKLLHSHLPKKKKALYSADVFEPVGLLHDIGKLGVPEIILNKSGKLNEKEWEFMKKHTTFGSNLLKTADDYEGFSDWIEYHHERIDGNGYLELNADDIPYISKLLAVVDTYSALVTNRPYRPGKTHEEALDIIISVKGKQLDAGTVDIFSGINKQEIESCKPDNLGFEAIDEIEKDIETYFKERELRKIISMSNSEAYINKLIDLAEQEQTIFSVCKILVTGSTEGSDIDDYHDADELTERIGQTLIDATRPTDLIFRVTRNSFLLIFPNNPRENSEKLVERIEDQVNQLPVVKTNKLDISLSKKFVHFDPNETQSFSNVKTFIQNC